jgi:hypothetical protein
VPGAVQASKPLPWKEVVSAGTAAGAAAGRCVAALSTGRASLRRTFSIRARSPPYVAVTAIPSVVAWYVREVPFRATWAARPVGAAGWTSRASVRPRALEGQL